eukprot:Colp12_sorted_trinity150504_noHs@11764
MISFLFPDYWDQYLAAIPAVERGDLMGAYYRRLIGDNKEEQMKAAKAWSTWECATSRLYVDPAMIDKAAKDEWALAFARIECHYFVHGGWFDHDNHLVDGAAKIRHIPATIVQGRYDVVCPAKTAWDLKKQWPEAEFHIVPDAGHSAKEPGIRSLLVQAADKYKTL